MAIVGIVAISKNYAIGRDGKLPWHYSEDLKFFKRTTTGHAVVMGSNTWRSVGGPLPNRLNIVLTTKDIDAPPTVIIVSNKAAVVELAKYIARDIFVIGGARTYAEFGEIIDKWIVTSVPDTAGDADTFMREDFLSGFEVTAEKTLERDLVVKFFERTGQTGV